MAEVTMVVRRYGRVGGMESYVFNLVGALLKVGVKVNIVSEERVEGVWGEETLFLVKASRSRSRWRQMSHFRSTVDLTINREKLRDNSIIHSHERTLYNDVTTMHGPLFRHSGYLRRIFSPRIRFWEAAEALELLGSTDSVVVTVSELARTELLSKYGELLPESRIVVGHPGVPASVISRNNQSNSPSWNGVKVVMVGREWARKGFDFGLSICEVLQKKLGLAVHVDLIGCPEFKHPNFPGLSINFKGWVDSWWTKAKYDLMLHPARVEPFGMAVCEAANARIPVICSNRVGALDFRCGHLISMPLSESIDLWAEKAVEVVKQNWSGDLAFDEIKWNWDDLARLHLRRIYPLALKRKHNA